MKRVGITTIAFLFLSQSAAADPSWSLISFSTTPQNAPKVVAAADKLMSSPAGKEFPGRLLLQQSIADGTSPATHSWAPIYKSVADREAFIQKLQADPAWDAFLATMSSTTEPVATVLYRTLKNWGEIVDTDPVWMAHAFAVSDPAAFEAALDKLIASPTGQKFPGQAYLSAVVAGGISPVTHVISVGYASEAEMEAWATTRNASADWGAYLAASRPAAEYLGGSLARTVKSWGPATLAEISGN